MLLANCHYDAKFKHGTQAADSPAACKQAFYDLATILTSRLSRDTLFIQDNRIDGRLKRRDRQPDFATSFWHRGHKAGG